MDNPQLPSKNIKRLEFLDGDDFIRESYLLLLGRLPDPQGLSYYRMRLDRGISKKKIISQLIKSGEVDNNRAADKLLHEEIKSWKRRSLTITDRLKGILQKLLRSRDVGNENLLRHMSSEIDNVLQTQAKIVADIAEIRANAQNASGTSVKAQSDHLSRQAKHIYHELRRSSKIQSK